MADQELIELLKRDVDQWNAWREQHRERSVDLREADLSQVDLREANLSGVYLSRANLRKVNLSGAYLIGADLNGADLREANLSGVYLSGADLSGVYLSRANLSGADLSEATLTRADLSGADLSGAILVKTVLGALDLRNVKGLVEIRHRGPSYIEQHTILLPQDGSALHFLRGAGVPDEWIEFWRSTSMHPIQYHSLFISYSSQDELLARRLHADLQAEGVRCWFAPEDLKIGDKLRPRIDEAIHLHEKLLLLLSEHALASAWVETEVETALEKERLHQREVLFPIRLDDSVLQTKEAWAAQLRRQRHIGDFTGWKDPGFRAPVP